ELAGRHERTRAEVRRVQDEAVRYAIGHLAETLVARYRDMPSVSAYLEEMQRDVLESTDLFVGGEAEGPPAGGDPPGGADPDLAFRKYRVNVIVDNADLKGAPIGVEDNPTYANLCGKLENEVR